MKRYAVVDIGTNSARLMIAHRTKDGGVEADYKTLRLVRVGEGMTGRILPAAMRRTAQALSEFVGISRHYDAHGRLFCFATSAVREAENSAEFAGYIRAECGLDIDVVSGKMEATLGFAGCIDGAGAMLDIGGGSTEVMTGSLDAVRYRRSFDIGTVRCLQLFPGADDADPRAFAAAHKLAAEAFSAVPREGFAYTGIGGTATALAAIDLGLPQYDAARIQGHAISLGAATALCETLKAKTKAQRKSLIGLEDNKADVIVFGAILFLEFLKAVGGARITISDRDNQEGYLQYRLGLIRF